MTPNNEYQHHCTIADGTLVPLSPKAASPRTGLPLAVRSPLLVASHPSLEAALLPRLHFRGQKLEWLQQGCHAFPFLVLIRQVSKQDGAAMSVETTGAWDVLEEDCARRRAVLVWVLSHLKYVWAEDFFHLWSSHRDRFWHPAIGKQRGSKGHLLVS